LKRVTEKKFGELNMKNAFSLENAPKKFYEQLQKLSSGIDLGPITKGLQDAFGQLSEDAPLGHAIKSFMSGIGTDFADIAGKSIPLVVEGFKWLVAGAINVATFFYEMRNKIKDAFGEEGWIGVGKAVVSGVAKGILASNNFVKDAVLSLAGNVKSVFVDKMGIHSPSKVFEGFGANTVEGYAQGVEKGQARSNAAVQGMVQAPAASPATAAAPTPEQTIEVHIHGVNTNSTDAMRSPDFLAALTRAIRDARTMKGVGVAT
jgi:hypothetical protein